jgi:hypothetical protein
MGVSIHANDNSMWVSSYSGYNAFRDELIAVTNTDRKEVDAITDPAHVHGIWFRTPAEPLMVLMAHSDCSGYILPMQAGAIADRLCDVKPLMSADWHDAIDGLIDGLNDAHSSNTVATFR